MATDAPPVGQPGFNLHADQQGRIVGSMITLLILSTAFVMLRMLSRKLSKAGFWLDDYLVVLALVRLAQSGSKHRSQYIDLILWPRHLQLDW